MKMKTAQSSVVVFLALACGLVLFAACEEKSANAGPPSSATASAEETEGPADKVVAYYFHGTRRCRTCLGIQKIVAQTVEGRFAAEVASGDLAFRDINYDLAENKHFAKEFELSFSTLVVGAMRGDTMLKWEKCDKIWQYAHKHALLGDYVAERVKAYLAMLKKS